MGCDMRTCTHRNNKKEQRKKEKIHIKMFKKYAPAQKDKYNIHIHKNYEQKKYIVKI